MKQGSKVGIVCCSNGLQRVLEPKVNKLTNVLKELGFIPVFSDYVYEGDLGFSGTGRERAAALMEFYQDNEIKAIFDISGGDIANELLPYLDYNIIRESKKKLWGYSDLTTIINGIYARTGGESVLYQIRNLVSKDADARIAQFSRAIFEENKDLYNFNYNFIQGDKIEGVVVGGNIRCLLKLAGTIYWPKMEGKALLLEAFSGTSPQMTTYLSQLSQIGVFDKIKGIILGTFTAMEEKEGTLAITDLVRSFTGDGIPMVKTKEVGHGADSKAVIIGRELKLTRDM